ncbi:hypothetical protein ABIE41_001289 [Bosea sp. OAE506]|uniref:TniQ family protein n=1 Tax=Bosea sp. OAE506 TaxID=2663870 RepID=UPI001789706F
MSSWNQDVVGVPRWEQPEPEEPAHGLFLRIAEINGLPPSDMARSMGFSLASLRRGYNIDKLARLVGCDELLLALNSFSFAVGEKVTIRGQTIGLRRDLLRKKRRVCRCCLAEAPYHRFWWDLRFIDFCPRHWINLEDRCFCENSHHWSWFDSSVGICRHCSEQMTSRKPDELAERKTAFDRHIIDTNAYLLGRLGVCTKKFVPILDELPLDEVIDVIERVGAFELGGYSKKWKTAANLRLPVEEVRARGFSMLATGFWAESRARDPSKYIEAFSHDPNPTINKKLGWFYHWFNGKGGKRFSPLEIVTWFGRGSLFDSKPNS